LTVAIKINAGDEMPEEQEKIITGVKFKLFFDNFEDKKEMNRYFDEYARAVTFAARKINEIQNSFKDTWVLDEQGKKQKGEDGKPLRPIEICNSCNEKKEIIKQEIESGKKFCLSCYSSTYSKPMIRKLLVPKTHGQEKRKVDPSINIKNAAALSATSYHYAVRDASQLLQALKEQRRKRRDFLKRDGSRLKKFKEMLDNENKRFQLPMKGRMRVPRFVHIDDKENTNLRGWRIKDLQNKVKRLQWNIDKLKRSLEKPSPIEYKGTKVSLSNDTIFDIQQNKVRIRLWKPKWYKISGSDVANRHGVEFFKDKLSKIQPKKYGWLIKKIDRNAKSSKTKTEYYNIPIKVKGTTRYISIDSINFYLQYPIEEQIEYRNPTTLMGIDIGLNKLAAVSVLPLNSNNVKPLLVKIFSGKEIKRLRYRKLKHDRMLRNVHHRLDKIKRIRSIENMINQQYHILAKQIADIADVNNSIVAFERLEDMKKKLKAEERRSQRFIRHSFVYATIRNLIEYKLKLRGLRTIEIDPEGTSYTCSKCGATNTTRPKQAIFKCNDCGVQLNADYNASVNIAKKALNTLNINK